MSFGLEVLGLQSCSYFSPIRTIVIRTSVYPDFSLIRTIVLRCPGIRTSSIRTPVGESVFPYGDVTNKGSIAQGRIVRQEMYGDVTYGEVLQWPL
jgi:hypothetical protein